MRDADIGNYGVANDGWKEDEKHDYPTKFEAVGDDGDNDCYHRGNGVRDHGPELGFVGGVPEFHNDGGEEETE